MVVVVVVVGVLLFSKASGPLGLGLLFAWFWVGGIKAWGYALELYVGTGESRFRFEGLGFGGPAARSFTSL